MNVVFRFLLCASLCLIPFSNLEAQVVFKKLVFRKQWPLFPADMTKGVDLKVKSTTNKTIRKIIVGCYSVNAIGDVVLNKNGHYNRLFTISGPIKPKKSFHGWLLNEYWYGDDLYAIPYHLYVEYMDETSDEIEITEYNYHKYFPKNKWMKVYFPKNNNPGNNNNSDLTNNTFQQPTSEEGYNNIPMPVYNGDGTSYVRQIQNRTDQQMANLNNSIQQMTQNAIAQAQYNNNRGLTAMSELANWCAQFSQQNGRNPYEQEKDTWMQQHYPDVYPTYIQAKYGDYNTNNNTQGSESNKRFNDPTGNKVKCPYCTNGRILIENPVPSYGGINTNKGYCKECDKTYSKGYTHTHVDCHHCKGKGYRIVE